MKSKTLFSGGPFDAGMWKFYNVSLKFVSRLCGSAPREGVLEDWALGIGSTVRAPSSRNIPDTLTAVLETATDVAELQDEAREKSTVGFWKIKDELVTPTYSLRAHIKDCVRQVEGLFIGKIAKQTSFQTRVKNGLYVKGEATDAKGVDMNWITRNGKKVKEDGIDGWQDRTMQVFIQGKGYQSCIKRFPYLVKPEINFQVGILGNIVKPEDLNVVFQYGATHGYGGERSMGEGRYTYEITEA